MYKKAGQFNHGDVFIAEVDIFFSYQKEKSRWALQKRTDDSELKIGDLLLCCLKTHAWLPPLLLSRVIKRKQDGRIMDNQTANILRYVKFQ